MSDIIDTSEVAEAHEMDGGSVSDEDGNVVPQWIVQGGEVNKAFINDLEVIAFCASLKDVTDSTEGVAILVLSSELALQLGRNLTSLAATVRPLTKQVEAREAAEAITNPSEEDNK